MPATGVTLAVLTAVSPFAPVTLAAIVTGASKRHT